MWYEREAGRQKEASVFYNLVLEGIDHQFCHMLVVMPNGARAVWEETTPGANARRRESLGAIFDAGYNSVYSLQ